MPLGFVSAKTGLVLWMLAQFVSLSVSLWMIWLLLGRPPTLLPLFGYLFAPALVCIQAGQISLFILLGIVLFLHLHETRPFFAGATLLPCALKPHLFLPFAIALLLWAISRSAYRILAGFSAALLAGFALTFFLDRNAWSQYVKMMRAENMLNEHVATLSSTLRFLVDPDATWLQFLPCVAACSWAIWYFWTHRDRWRWINEGLLVLLVSAMCTPYGWFFDESVLLPAVLVGVFRARQSRRSLLPIALVAGAALVEMNMSPKLISPAYLWTTPAWLLWFVFASSADKPSRKSINEPFSNRSNAVAGPEES
jgi:hypothetical protein